MGSLRVTLCTGLLAATALVTPAAHAADGGEVAVTPSSTAAGAEVALRVSGCSAGSGRAVSAAFAADAELTGAAGTLVGAARLSATVEAGTYDVKVSCGDVSREGALTVVQGPSRQPSPYASPVAPVHAGGGGTARLADAEGPGMAHAVTGLVLAGVAAVAVVLRGSRRRRGNG